MISLIFLVTSIVINVVLLAGYVGLSICNLGHLWPALHCLYIVIGLAGIKFMIPHV